MLEKSVSGVTNLWQLNNEYTTQIVFYLLTSFRHYVYYYDSYFLTITI